MRSGELIRRARHRAGLTQRELAERAQTSHATVAAYETGAKVPRVDTLERILQAAGFVPEVALRPRADSSPAERERKGRELREALELASMFPLRRRRPDLPAPELRRRPPSVRRADLPMPPLRSRPSATT
jgi:transcriptional regulator with XRE-family HTH domain